MPSWKRWQCIQLQSEGHVTVDLCPLEAGMPRVPRLQASVRNISLELLEAQGHHEIAATKKELELASAAALEVEAEWKEKTSGLAVGGQSLQSVEARKQALVRAEGDITKAQEALAAARSLPGEPPENAGTSKRAQAIFRATTMMEQAQKRVERERRAVKLAEDLEKLDARRGQSKAELRQAYQKNCLALEQVKALSSELAKQDGRGQMLSMHVVLAVTADKQALAKLTCLAHLEKLVSVQHRVLLKDIARGEMSVDAHVVIAALPVEAQEESCEMLLRFDMKPSADSDVKNGMSEPWYALVGRHHAKALRLQARRPPQRPRCVQLLQAWVGLAPLIRLDNVLAVAMEALLRPQKIHVPAGLLATMRPYQVHGFQWLATNATNGLGSLLADDMGLGKTLQVIALLLHLKGKGLLHRPALIVVPLAVLANWVAELSRWAPTLTCYVYRRSGRDLPQASSPWRKACEGSQGISESVVLTTYSVVLRDVEVLSQARFAAMVLDECPQIKNSSSNTSQVRTSSGIHKPLDVALAFFDGMAF